MSELIHRPFGDRHPYESTTDERVPRHPHPQDVVELRALTRPIGAAKNMLVSYWDQRFPDQVNSKQVALTESIEEEVAFTEDGHLSEAAARAGLIVGVDEWQVTLPAFAAGTVVCYQFSAETPTSPLNSPTYTYTVRQTIALDTLAATYLGANALILALQNDTADHAGYLRLSLATNGHLQVTAGHGNCPDIENSALKKVNETRFSFGATTIQIDANQFGLNLFHQDKLIVTGMQPPKLIIGDDNFVEAVIFAFAAPEDEAFYGFGERFNALDQRGQRLDVRVYEQYKNHGLRTYMPMPLLVSSMGYGLLVQTLRHSLFDLAHDDPNRWTLTTELGAEKQITLDLLLGSDTNLLDIVARLTTLTGLPTLPPDWAFGLWISGNEWNSQARVEEIMRQHKRHDIPASVIVLEAWSDENTFYIWNDTQYQPKSGDASFRYADFEFPPDGLWPDPKGMVDELHEQGMRVLLWQIPILKVNEDGNAQLDQDKAHMLEKGYCVQQADGEPYQIRPFWFHDGLLMDFTHPQGVDWWMQKREYLLREIGIDGFKTDGGEHIWGRDLQFADGRGGDEVWNEYPNLYAGAYFNYARTIKPDAITFSRAGFTGAQAFPCHWAGDENSTWEAFRHSVLAGLNAGISGVSFWGWDFAGFSGDIPSAELYLRASAMAAFCPIMQYHSEYNHHRQPSNDRTPWNIQERTGDETVIPTFRFLNDVRLKLRPYIEYEALQSSLIGIPMMRALSLAFPTDRQCRQFPYQYMFGSALLVAPVVAEGVSKWPLYLPTGEWRDLWTGEQYNGGQVIHYDVSTIKIPVFVRAGVDLPINLDDLP